MYSKLLAMQILPKSYGLEYSPTKILLSTQINTNLIIDNERQNDIYHMPIYARLVTTDHVIEDFQLPLIFSTK
jgi:hypothetical protein